MYRGVKIIVVLLVELLAWNSAAMWGQKDWKFAKPGVKSSAIESGQITQGQVDRYALHFWDGENVELLGMRLLSSDAEVALETETQLANFFSVLLVATPDTSRKAVNNLMDRAGNSYQSIMDIAEKYFYNVQSPYYNEDKFLLFLEHKIARLDIPKIEKSREKFLAFMIKRNPVGYVAEDFEYSTLKGETCNLGDLFNNYSISITKPACNGNGEGVVEYKSEKVLRSSPVMVVFFTADCRDCREGIKTLSYSAVVRNLVREKKLRVLAICTEGNLSSASSIIPKDWIAGSDGGYITRHRLYSIKHTPSVYLMDGEGKVLLRDASVSSAIQFLLEQDE